MLPNKILGIFNMYGIMIAVGILCCFLLLFYYGKKRKIQDKFIDFVFYNAIASIIVGFFTAALFQATYDYIDDPEGGFNLFGSGITFIGGLIGGVVCFLALYAVFRKKFQSKVLDILSFAPCCITIAHAFGRIGCFCAGCCYGAQTDSFLGVTFPGMSHAVHPTMLYEAAFLFLLCAVIFLLVMKWDFKHGLSVYLISYGIFRFGLEFLRADDRGSFIGKLSPSQFWSIVMVVIGVGLIFFVQYLWKQRKNAPAVETEQSQASESVTLETSEPKETVEGAEEQPQTQQTETTEQSEETNEAEK